MKTLITFFLVIGLPSLAFTQTNSEIKNTPCDEITKRREYKEMLGEGIILHKSCKDSTHYFFLLQERTDTIGELLNEDYRILGHKLKITSTGSRFFVVRGSYPKGKYQYDRNNKSWYFDRIYPSGWSIGNREDP